MRLLIVGTGTDVGKTHVSACLLRYARAQGIRARGYKPIATGVSGRCEDAEHHAAALGAAYIAPTFSYTRPVSPHLAAREEGGPIDLALVQKRADELAEGVDALLIESAGGLFTPLGTALTNLDMAAALAPVLTVLVAPDRLGVLSDLSAYVRAARASGLEVPMFVLSAPERPDASTGLNRAELDALGIGLVGGVFPRASADAGASQSVAAGVWSLLEKLDAQLVARGFDGPSRLKE
jgi:dethiobiotin synthetase